MFDRSAEFEKIEELLNEVRIQCNRAMIPFIWIAAVWDDGKETGYKVAIDENQEKRKADKKYVCNALVPGSMEVSLADDKIKEIVKVLNGFKAVPKEPLPAVNPEDFTYANRIRKDGTYQRDEEGIYMAMAEEEEAEGILCSNMSQELMASDSDVPEEDWLPDGALISIDFKPNGDLPVIDDDFE